jgi:phosphopantothenoylcysteine decarboxylase/phosphopantothenate--cysteine ligase
MLTATLLSARSPVVVAPAMHTRMYDHPATQLNLEMLKQRGVHIVEPVEGELASGFGRGRLAEPEAILDAIEAVLTPKDLQDLHLLVTAGPTVESLDPVRFISNHSTGRMGYAIAHQARLRGATVYLVSGPTSLKPPPGVLLVPVRSADEMHTQVMRLYPEVNAVVMSAAVADYTPAQVATQKLKKSTEKLSIDLVPTVDILAALGRRRKEEATSSQPGPVLVGFAMETEALEAHARSKLERKGCDLIVANDLHEPGAGFGHDTNRVTVIDRTGAVDRWPLLSKREVGERLLDRIAGLQQGRSVEQ